MSFRSLAFVLLLLGATCTSHGQLGELVNLGKKLKESARSGDAGAFSASLDEVSAHVVKSRIAFMESKAKLAEALGMKTDRYVKAGEELRAKEDEAPKSGARVAALNDSRKATAEADAELEAKLEKSALLSDEAKTTFAEGSEEFIDAVVQLKAQAQAVHELAERGKTIVASASLLEKAKVAGLVGPATQLTAALTGDLKQVMGTLTKILSLAKQHDVALAGGAKAEEALAER